MVDIHINRNAKKRWRASIVCAMLPLAVMNSHVTLGCGCSGHFEAACQCKCDGSCRSDSATCICSQKKGCEHSRQFRFRVSKETCFDGHHCVGAVRREITAATLAHICPHADEASTAAFTFIAIDSVAAYSPSAILYPMEHSIPPPFDRVVALRHLLI